MEDKGQCFNYLGGILRVQEKQDVVSFSFISPLISVSGEEPKCVHVVDNILTRISQELVALSKCIASTEETFLASGNSTVH